MTGTQELNVAYWRAGILAADAADWITVAAYAIAAVLALYAARAATARDVPRERLFWQFTAAAMLALGINEVFDFQLLLTALGKEWAQSHGLYEQRRTFQLIFIICLAGAALVAGAATLALMRRAHRAVRLALLGLGFIAVFVLIRAASFHHVDSLLGMGPRSFNFGSIQEMAGIVLVGFSAYLYVPRGTGGTARGED